MKIHYYLDVRRPQPDGRCQVMLSAYEARERVFIPTDVWITPAQWDSAKEKDRRSAANNALLSAFFERARDFIAENMRKGARPNVKALRDALRGVQSSPLTLLSYFGKLAKLKEAENTRKLWLDSIEKIRAYAGARADDLTFQDITPTWLQGFDAFMAQSMKINSRGIHLRNLRTVFNAAIDDELTTCYPFRRFRVKHEETRKRSLSVEQLRRIIFSPACEQRDIFVLIFCLQGINITDLCRLTPDDYDGERLEYRRAKTGRLFSIKVEPEAAEIMEKYKGKNGVYLLDILERWKSVESYKSKLNKRLKQIYPDLPPLSSYWARHTYATLLAEMDTPVETIGLALGHSVGSRVTQIYIRPNLQKVDEANRRLLDWVWRKK